jgi:hypothetical protein
MGEKRNKYKILVRKPEGKRPLRRESQRWKDKIRTGLRETKMGGCGLYSSGSGQGPVAGS